MFFLYHKIYEKCLSHRICNWVHIFSSTIFFLLFQFIHIQSVYVESSSSRVATASSIQIFFCIQGSWFEILRRNFHRINYKKKKNFHFFLVTFIATHFMVLTFRNLFERFVKKLIVIHMPIHIRLIIVFNHFFLFNCL